jgi:hypothetical protein
MPSRLLPVDRRGDAIGQAVAAADHREAHAVLDQALDLVGEIEAEQRHQACDFSFRAAPIVAGERKERQRSNSLFRRGLDNASD